MQGTRWMPIMMDAHNERDQFERYLDLLLERRIEGLIVVANWLFDEGGLIERVANACPPSWSAATSPNSISVP